MEPTDPIVHLVEGPQPGSPAHHKELQAYLEIQCLKARRWTVLTNGINRWTVISWKEE